MALADIIDLEEHRRSRRPVVQTVPSAAGPLWCYVWMPVYYWYV